ncbi:phosphopantetheine-binding protein, partial [Streptomyces sp. NPDC048516]|uniref:phosphopantetheine-binding protein n=1 Tax=Streptomyces sp. NPDC048516 TaxID=3365565 RepID=UPI003721E835
LAWGLWQHTTNLTTHLHTTDHQRLNRAGITPISDEEGLALFDAALTLDRPTLVAARIDTPQLRLQASAGLLPGLFRGLLRTPQRRASTTVTPAAELADRLARLPVAEQESLLTDLIRSHVATVLGHSSPTRVEVDRGFLDMGFSSLTAVELRNRLNAAVGLRLPTSVVFDHATPLALARHVRTQVLPEDSVSFQPFLTELDELERDLLAISPDTRMSLSIRLQDFLLKLNQVQDTEGTVGDTFTDRIDTATDDEVFELIDRELGIS